MATEYRVKAIISLTEIWAEMRDVFTGTNELVFSELRPGNLAEADTALMAHGLQRVGEWDLGYPGTVETKARFIDNKFNGTRAARLDTLVGKTHWEWEKVVLGFNSEGEPTVQDGDLIGPSGLGEGDPYVVAGSRFENEVARIHMVGEGKTWDDRHTTNFAFGRMVKVARRKG